MKPKYFMDIRLKHAGMSEELCVLALRGKLFSILHSLFQKKPKAHALAIPKCGRLLRVFASESQALVHLTNELATFPWIRDYADLGGPVAVPESFDGGWVKYQRFRIPTVKSDRNAVDGMSALRNRRIQTAMDSKLHYFNISSGSTRQRFTLIVQELFGDPVTVDISPNSYGLGSSDNLVSVPDIR